MGANFKFSRQGSAKDILRVDDESLGFRFTDHFSVFDVGRSKDEIPGKANAICACSLKSFEIARSIGIPTHFIERIDAVTIRVRECRTDLPTLEGCIAMTEENYVVPLEWIYRLRVAGSILRAFRSGTKKPEAYGLPAGEIPEEGASFSYPVHMLTTKFEKVDRDLNKHEACLMAGISYVDHEHFLSMIDRLTGATSLAAHRAGFAILDGKMECLMGPGRAKMIGDVFVTPDEDRPVLLHPLENGEVIHYGKEFVRQVFIKMGYYDELKKARAKGQPDLPLPKLDRDTIKEAGRRYEEFAQAYAGEYLKY